MFGQENTSGIRACRICGNEVGNKSYSVPEMMFGTGNVFPYFQCSECECLQIKDIPLDPSTHYPEDYYSNTGKKDLSSKLNSFALGLRDRYAYLERGQIGRIIHSLAPSSALKHIKSLRLPLYARILDVGSGNGRQLRVLAGLGFKHLDGVDPYISRDLAFGHAVRIFKHPLETFTGEYDLVMLHHSLEHMPDQDSALASVRCLLAPGGIALVRVPCVSSYAWERYGVHWVGLDAPRHFYLHSLKSLHLITARANLGISRIVWDSLASQFWASNQYEKGIPLHSKRSLMENYPKLLCSYRMLHEMGKLADNLNKEGRGDQLALFLGKE